MYNIHGEAKERKLRILISSSRTILIIPVQCIKFWFDFENPSLGNCSLDEKKRHLLSIQKNIMELAVIIHKELCDKFNDWPKDYFKFDINVGKNAVPTYSL